MSTLERRQEMNITRNNNVFSLAVLSWCLQLDLYNNYIVKNYYYNMKPLTMKKNWYGCSLLSDVIRRNCFWCALKELSSIILIKTEFWWNWRYDGLGEPTATPDKNISASSTWIVSGIKAIVTILQLKDKYNWFSKIGFFLFFGWYSEY